MVVSGLCGIILIAVYEFSNMGVGISDNIEYNCALDKISGPEVGYNSLPSE